MDAPLDGAGRGQLSTTAAPRPVPRHASRLRVEATVPLDLDAAFALFADRLGTLWPEGSPLATVEAALTLWDPPRRIGATWPPGSHVEVQFAEVDDDLTTVIVEHDDLDLHDLDLRHLITGDDGWWAALRAYVAAGRA